MRVWSDLDGVLADLEEGYWRTFGIRSTKEQDAIDWDLVRTCPGFFASLPPCPGAFELWYYLKPYNPPILTGLPKSMADEALANKRSWVARHLGPKVKVVGCRSKDKCLHGKPGDVLIDDWQKYQKQWERMGGIFIHHTSAESTVQQLGALGL